MTQQSAGSAPHGLVGTWRLVAIEMRIENGDWAPAPMAGRPIGLLVYDGRGNMTIQITTDPPSSKDNRAPFRFQNGYLAYFGTYEVDEAAGTVTHHRLAQNYSVGRGDDVRGYTLDGDTLTLMLGAGLKVRVRWVRDR